MNDGGPRSRRAPRGRPGPPPPLRIDDARRLTVPPTFRARPGGPGARFPTRRPRRPSNRIPGRRITAGGAGAPAAVCRRRLVPLEAWTRQQHANCTGAGSPECGRRRRRNSTGSPAKCSPTTWWATGPAAHWLFTADYVDGVPGATASPGTGVRYPGADFFRVRDGRFAEYWVVGDTMTLMAQLGALGPEAG